MIYRYDSKIRPKTEAMYFGFEFCDVHGVRTYYGRLAKDMSVREMYEKGTDQTHYDNPYLLIIDVAEKHMGLTKNRTHHEYSNIVCDTPEEVLQEMKAAFFAKETLLQTTMNQAVKYLEALIQNMKGAPR